MLLFPHGVSLCEARRPIHPRPILIDFADLFRGSSFRTIGPTGGDKKNGVRGAPIVEDDEEMGCLSGFFQLADNEICFESDDGRDHGSEMGLTLAIQVRLTMGSCYGGGHVCYYPER